MKKIISIAIVFMLAGSITADDIAVTVYNNNLGVVSENRSLSFKDGEGILKIRNVPSLIDAASVRFDILDNFSGNINILEQNYAYDLVSPEKIYDRFIDETIELIDENGHSYKGQLLAFSNYTATLMSNSGSIKVIRLDKVTEINFPSLPDGLITRPTLFWKYTSDYSGDVMGNLSYQTGGMNWKAEYVGLLNSDETLLDLSGWASINNNSGKTYDDAKLKLVAGDIHRPSEDLFIRGGRAKSVALAEFDSFEEKVFFEYHLYTLPRRATLANKEQKQISLFEPASTKVEKVFLFKPGNNNSKVEVIIKFVNSEKAGLGMPLPAGRIRLFKADDDNSLILLGEDNIKHTPKNEELKLKVGNAFDLIGRESILNKKIISHKIEDHDIEIELTNRKDSVVRIEIEKKLYGFWEITQADFEYEKQDAQTILFKADIKADSKVKLKYSVRYTYR